MSEKELANVGLFVLSLALYFLPTAMLGGAITEFDDGAWPFAAWLIGGIMFAFAIVLLLRGA